MERPVAVSVRGLAKQFGHINAVAGLSFEVHEGEIFGLVGPDGAGKSTTLRLLMGLLELSGGDATVLGYDLRRQSDYIKRHAGYLAQRFALYGDLTVMENLRFYATEYGVPPALARERSDELIRVSGLERARERAAMHLSGGMRQKLGLVCSLIHEPDLLVLDEPTTGVDPVARRQFWRILHRFSRGGKTVIISTPYMDEAERCSRVGLVYEGRMLACGTPEELRALAHDGLLEVRFDAGSLRPLRALLERVPGVRGSHPYGSYLHLAVDDAPAVGPRVAAALEAAGYPARVVAAWEESETASDVEVQAIPPSLEDVYIALVREVRRGR